MAQSKSLKRNILGITGLASVWSTSGPSEPVASLTPPLTKKTAAWDLTVKWPFTDQPDKEGYDTLAQLWLAAKALTTNCQRLYEELCCTSLPV